ncbi:hypothetical protein D555_4066 [Bordetella holmesii 35009]|nr:hypothetical protein D555_4066 [Bordetella holmesii 35009]
MGASAAAPVAREVFDYWLGPKRQDKIERAPAPASEPESAK